MEIEKREEGLLEPSAFPRLVGLAGVHGDAPLDRGAEAGLREKLWENDGTDLPGGRKNDEGERLERARRTLGSVEHLGDTGDVSCSLVEEGRASSACGKGAT